MANFPVSIVVSTIGGEPPVIGGLGQSAATATAVQPGDTITFTRSGASNGDAVISGVATNIFSGGGATLTSGSPTHVITVLATPVKGVADQISIAADNGEVGNVYAIVEYAQPFKNLSLQDSATSIDVNDLATDHSITIVDRSNNRTDTAAADNTDFRVRQGSTVISGATRTDLGLISNIASAPANIGETLSYNVQARLDSANGGDNFWQSTNLTYSVNKVGVQGSADPFALAYGIAIYDDSANLVASFSDGSSLIRRVATTTVTTSTTGTVDWNTGKTGINEINGLVQIRGQDVSGSPEEGEYNINLATRILSDSANDEVTVRIGRDKTARSVRIDLLQSRGPSR